MYLTVVSRVLFMKTWLLYFNLFPINSS